jgi:hypothetical protein
MAPRFWRRHPLLGCFLRATAFEKVHSSKRPIQSVTQAMPHAGPQWIGGFFSKNMSAQAVFDCCFCLTLVLKHSFGFLSVPYRTLFVPPRPAQSHSQTVTQHWFVLKDH